MRPARLACRLRYIRTSKAEGWAASGGCRVLLGLFNLTNRGGRGSCEIEIPEAGGCLEGGLASGCSHTHRGRCAAFISPPPPVLTKKIACGSPLRAGPVGTARPPLSQWRTETAPTGRRSMRPWGVARRHICHRRPPRPDWPSSRPWRRCAAGARRVRISGACGRWRLRAPGSRGGPRVARWRRGAGRGSGRRLRRGWRGSRCLSRLLG